MHFGRFAASLVAVLLAAVIPAGAAGSSPQEAQLYPKPKSPLSELFKVPASSEAQVVPEALTTEVHVAVQRDFTPRIVCGMKMIEGTADMDPGIVIPIPELHGAKIRVLGPPPCDEFSSGRTVIIQGVTFGTGIRLPDRR